MEEMQHWVLQDLDSCRLRLDPELGRHRYERKISFAGILDDEDGHDSLNSSSHTLKSDTTCDDKKPQEAQGEIRCADRGRWVRHCPVSLFS